MSETTPTPAPAIFPTLRYRDPAAAIAFLVVAFGFERWMVMPGADGMVVHAELGLGPVGVMLGALPAGEAVAPAGVYLALPEVDAHYARAVAAGATIERELADTEYGSREYTARDPEGHRWSFGNYWPDSTLRAG